METENWLPVLGFPKYEVSDLGRIRRVGSEACRKSRIVKTYHCVNLTNGSRESHSTLKVHRIVAAAFLGPCPPGLQVNHIDGDKGNNRLDNLEYVTPKENSMHSVRTGLYPFGERHGWSTHPESRPQGERSGKRTHLTDNDVRELRRLRSEGWTYRQLMGRFGISNPCVSHIVSRRTWKHLT